MIVKMLPKIRYCNRDMFCTVGRKNRFLVFYIKNLYSILD